MQKLAQNYAVVISRKGSRIIFAIRTSFTLDDKLYLARLSLIRDRLGGSVCAKLGVLPLDDLVTRVGPCLL